MHPEFLLPDFGTACMYLCNDRLAERLLEVSELATRHLEQGVDPAVLFGLLQGQHCDFFKFYETMSLFALAARVNGNEDQEAKFLAGVRASLRAGPTSRIPFWCGGLDESTVEAVLAEGRSKGASPSFESAVRQVSAAL